MSQNIHYRNYIQQNILEGKTHQEIYDDVVVKYDITIHEAAETIRKMPTLEKRNTYAKSNNALIISIIINLVTGIIYRYSETRSGFSLLPNIITCVLIYGLVYYKSSAHLIAGIICTVQTLALIPFLILNFETSGLLDFSLSVETTVLAFYLNNKLVSDYILNKDLLQQDKTARVGAITFID